MKKHLLTALLSFLTACELIVDVTIPFDHAQLTVNAFACPDSLWKADISLNRYILNDSTDFAKVENASVQVYDENGNSVATLIHQGHGMYRSATQKPVVGKSYELRVSTDGYSSITAHTSIPAPVAITSATFVDNSTDSEQKATMRLKFNDPPGQANYYLVMLQSGNDYLDENDNVSNYPGYVNISSEDPAISKDNIGNADFGVYVRDVFFDGKEADLSFSTTNTSVLYASSIIITLQALSSEYYNYKSTAMLQQSTSGNPFAQPVNIQGNISNGFGLFGGYSQAQLVHMHLVPVITSITPMSGKPGDHIVIRGENLKSETSFSEVAFKAVVNNRHVRNYVVPVQQSDEELEVIVPEHAVSGKIAVYVNGRIAVSDQEFEIIQ